MKLPPKSFQLLVALLLSAWALSSDTLGHFVKLSFYTYAAIIALTYVLPPYRSHTTTIRPLTFSYVLITGCTNGLGLEMSKRFAKLGWNLLLVARDAKAAEALAKDLAQKYQIKTEVIATDLDKLDSADQILQQMKAKGFDTKEQRQEKKFVDILINNAGFGATEYFLATKIEALQSMLLLHCNTTTKLIHNLLPGMLTRERGRVVVTASMIGYLPSPRAAIYAATKAYLVSLCNSLQYEVGLDVDKLTRGTGRSAGAPSPNLGVVCVTPGATRTRFAEGSASEKSLIFNIPGLSMETGVVVEEIVDGVIEGKSHILPGWVNRFTVATLPLMPLKLSQFICFVLWGHGELKKDFFDSKRALEHTNTEAHFESKEAMSQERK